MIECKYKWQLQVLNQGLNTWFCSFHQKSVNEDICSQCHDRDGSLPKTVAGPLDFPKRNDLEIVRIYEVCKGCPLFNADKRCDKMPYEMHPTDILAQNPSNHCPEDKW